MADADVVRALAAWALVHEMADEGWKAAVARGGGEADGTQPGDVVDGMSSLIFDEKERLKGELAAMAAVPATERAEAATAAEDLRFELAEIRGRLESMESALEAISRRLPPAGDDAV